MSNKKLVKRIMKEKLIINCQTLEEPEVKVVK